MACASVFDAFKLATESLSREVYHRASFNSIWMNLIPKGVFPKEIGVTRTLFEMGNVYPLVDQRSWTAVDSTMINEGTACDNSFIDYEVGYNELTYSPERLALRGPVLCKDAAYFQHAYDEFLSGYQNELVKMVDVELSNHFQTRYSEFATKAVATGSFPISYQTTLTLTAATSQLTMQMLDKLCVTLINDRATNPDSQGFISMGPNGPLFSIYAGLDITQAIRQNNSEFRQDIRWEQSGLLLQRLGATTAVKNWRFVPWLTPPRYSHNGAAYVRVNTYVSSAGTNGTIYDLNPDYIDPTTAPYEGAIVLSPDVMQWDIVSPSNSHPFGANYPASNYVGDWMFKTGTEAVGPDCYDPLNKKGRHFAEFIGAPKPGSNRRSGCLVIFKRCPRTNFDTVTCT